MRNKFPVIFLVLLFPLVLGWAMARAADQQNAAGFKIVLSDGSLTGKALHTLVGYADRPTGIQLIVYGATLATIFTLMRLFGHAPQSRQAVTHTQGGVRTAV